MWPFSKKSRAVDRTIELLPAIIETAKVSWLEFSRTLVFKEDVPLKKRITAFAIPTIDGIRDSDNEMREIPESLLLLANAIGIMNSGTHTKQEIETALGVRIPDDA